MSNKNLTLVALVFFAAGCGLETRTYVMTKDRVGLDQGSGNGGCVMGKCAPQPPKETTRKVYVLEITRPVPESQVQKIEETAVNAITDSAVTPPVNSTPAESAPAVSADVPTAPAAAVVPVVGDETAPAAPNGGSMQPQTYTVQKDDTLQKISKKVFGSYGKWYKIYEANKDKIKNPNVLKTGTVLDIPVIK
jgi:nucleoid-associated protein YgaU